ncbi:MAG: sodium:proton antiporter [Synergistetes bacterium]|nr:sodium:proton antiporter [Synergistota bacterium]MCX8127724.1 sodium:proton antiporter [Synergistota bacterium]MDW8191361.1 MnhB domain-containing protein [Synergistota bacterium]
MSMSKIVKTITALTFWAIIVFGLYVVIHGHLTPGGGFQGGAVIASSTALFLVAFSKEDFLRKYKDSFFSVAESGGLILFISIAFLGIGATFFYNFIANSGGVFGNPVPLGINDGDLNTAGTLPPMNMAVGLEVFGGISMILFFMFLGAYLKPFNKEESEVHKR